MGCCDATDTETLTAGDDWVWVYIDPIDDAGAPVDVSGWSDPVFEIRDSSDGLFASSNPDPGEGVAALVLTGGLDGNVPATNFADSVLAFFVAAGSTGSPPSVVYVTGRAIVGGVDKTVYSQTYATAPNGAVRS